MNGPRYVNITDTLALSLIVFVGIEYQWHRPESVIGGYEDDEATLDWSNGQVL
jgi:hypothetical protein